MSKILEGNPTKKAHSKTEYTPEMIEELRKCSEPQSGHLYFITNYGYIKHPSRGQIIYQPFNYQYRLIEVYHNYHFSISMCGRQMGKCCSPDTTITIRNKKTGEIKNLTMEEFHESLKKGS